MNTEQWISTNLSPDRKESTFTPESHLAKLIEQMYTPGSRQSPAIDLYQDPEERLTIAVKNAYEFWSRYYKENVPELTLDTLPVPSGEEPVAPESLKAFRRFFTLGSSGTADVPELLKQVFHPEDWPLIASALVWDSILLNKSQDLELCSFEDENGNYVSPKERNGRIKIHWEPSRTTTHYGRRTVKAIKASGSDSEEPTLKLPTGKSVNYVNEQLEVALSTLQSSPDKFLQLTMNGKEDAASQIHFALGCVSSTNKKLTTFNRAFPEAISFAPPSPETRSIPKIVWLLRNPGYGADFAEDCNSTDSLTKPKRNKANQLEENPLTRILDQLSLFANVIQHVAEPPNSTGAQSTSDQDSTSGMWCESRLPWDDPAPVLLGIENLDRLTKGWYRENAEPLFESAATDNKQINDDQGTNDLKGEDSEHPFRLEQAGELARLELYPYRTNSGREIPALISSLNAAGIFLPSQEHTLQVLVALLELPKENRPLFAVRGLPDWIASLKAFAESAKFSESSAEELVKRLEENALTFAGRGGAGFSFNNLHLPLQTRIKEAKNLRPW